MENNHGDVLNRYRGRLTEELPELQFHLVGDGDEILARARSMPVRWDGRIEDLPAGIDGAIARGFDEGGANVLCALVIMIPRNLQGRGLSTVAVQALHELAHRHGLTALIAPVRPSWKERYPLVPIDRYAGWRRADGLFFDPWIRVHERLGATVLKPEPRSLRITGTVAEWEEWTRMAFPESGDYWFRGGLVTVTIDRERDRGQLLGAERVDAARGLVVAADDFPRDGPAVKLPANLGFPRSACERETSSARGRGFGGCPLARSPGTQMSRARPQPPPRP